MKKFTIILVMLLMAATSFNQSSRRTANNSRPAGDDEKKSTSKTRTTVNKTKSRTHKKFDKVSDKNVKSDRTGTRRTTGSSRVYNQPERNRNTANTTSRRTSGSNSNYSQTEKNRNTASSNRRTSTGSTNYNHKGTNRNTAGHTGRRTVNVNRTSNNYTSSRVYVKSRPVKYTHSYPVYTREYRSRVYPYRKPHRVRVYWTYSMRDRYYRLYPSIKWYYYPIGYRIETISAYDALFYTGEVMNVYGKVYEVFYSRTTDEYFVYFGSYYPNHDFTVVIPGWVARRFSHRPERYFEREYMLVTGLITNFNGEPEIVIKSASQIRIY